MHIASFHFSEILTACISIQTSLLVAHLVWCEFDFHGYNCHFYPDIGTKPPIKMIYIWVFLFKCTVSTSSVYMLLYACFMYWDMYLTVTICLYSKHMSNKCKHYLKYLKYTKWLICIFIDQQSVSSLNGCLDWWTKWQALILCKFQQAAWNIQYMRLQHNKTEEYSEMIFCQIEVHILVKNDVIDLHKYKQSGNR